MDRWVCSRLYSTLLQCEENLPALELHLVTSSLRSFWLHSLCDVYLVSPGRPGGPTTEEEPRRSTESLQEETRSDLT